MNALEAIKQGRIAEAIDLLLDEQTILDNDEFYKSIILLSGGFYRVKLDYDRGGIKYEEYTLRQNHISSGLFDIANHAYRRSYHFELSPDTIETIAVLKIESEELIKKELNMIKDILKTVIPDFEDKFPENIHDKVFDEVRANTVFKEHQSRALIFGATNSGKTTTLNYILGSPIFPAKNEYSTTKSVLCGQHQNGLIFYDTPGLDDKDEYENITRCLLKLNELPDSPIDKLNLLDFTNNKIEAKEVSHIKLSHSEVSMELSDKNAVNIIEGRVFDKLLFRDWLYNRINFLIFIMNPEEGLKDRVCKVLANVNKQNSGKFKIFKIVNIQTKGGQASQYLSDLDRVRMKYELVDQSLNRLVELGIEDANSWFCVDSKEGLGFEALIQSMAASLPPEVLHDLNINIKNRYSNLISDALNKRYKTFVIEIASIIGTYPVNSDVEGIDILDFANQSIIFMAEYIYELRNGELKAMSKSFKKKLATFKEKRYKTKYYEVTPKKTTKVDRVVLYDNLIDNLLVVLGIQEPLIHTETIDIPPEKGSYGYYRVGSIKGIELILTVGKAIMNMANDNNLSPLNFSPENIAKYSVTISDSDTITGYINTASRWEDKRPEMINNIKPLLHKYI